MILKPGLKNTCINTVISITPAVFTIICGLAVRYLFFISVDPPLCFSDTPTYMDGAFSIFHHLHMNEYRPPVYPAGLMLSGILFNWENVGTGIIYFQIVLSAVNSFYVFKLVSLSFGNKLLAYFAAFMVTISYKIFAWDFVILAENFSILTVTLLTYNLIMYIKYYKKATLAIIWVLSVLAIFTKPFFLFIPFIILLIFAASIFIYGNKVIRSHTRLAVTGFIAVYICVFAYSMVNYLQNGYFGLTTVSNVNSFGKVIQYKMENLGDNKKLIGDIKHAMENEKDEYKVGNEFLEPWHFIYSYRWEGNHYSEVGRFSRQVILHHPAEYAARSIKLTYELIVLDSQIRNYIADAALTRAGHPNKTLLALRKFTDIFDRLYIFLSLCAIEMFIIIIFVKRKAFNIEKQATFIILVIILYHFLVSAFISYGDYSRLIAPCYALIYSIICLNIYRVVSYFAAVIECIAGRILKAGN